MSDQDDSKPDRQTMRDVSHTPPHDTSADGVWERGPTSADADAAPADD